MKIEGYIFFYIVGLMMISCTTQVNPQKSEIKEWTEAQKRRYFRDSVATCDMNTGICTDTNRFFGCFFNKHYPEVKAINEDDYLLYCLEESYIDTANLDTNRSMIRISVVPTFYTPYCIILEKQFDKTFLTLKTTNGKGGLNIGEFNFSMTQFLETELYDSCSMTLNKAHFFKLPFESKWKMLDGTRYSIEWLENGKYNYINRQESQYIEPELMNFIGALDVLKQKYDLNKWIGETGKIARD
ncbi:MAG: hypothetical protein V4613_00800 [Bacteroidota bacterium]